MKVISTDVRDLRNEFRYKQKAAAKLVMLGYFWDLDVEGLLMKTKFHAICELSDEDLETVYDQDESEVKVALYRVYRCSDDFCSDDFVEVPVLITRLTDVVC